MLISNIKSFADLNAKKNLQKQLLEVEANNELENQRRMQDFKDPYTPKPVPQQEKTSSELRKDRQFNEQEARKNLESFNMNYQDASSVIIWLDNNNRLIDFNANFKGIKRDIEANYNPKLVSPQWFENYLERYFEEVDVNYGRKMDSGIVELPLASSLEELKGIIPDDNQIEKLMGILEDIYYINDNEINKLIVEIRKLLLLYEYMLIDKNLEEILLVKLNQKDRNTFVKRYITVLKNMNFISRNEMDEYINNFNKFLNYLSRTGILNLSNRLYKQLYNINRDKDINNLLKLYRDLDKDIKNIPNTEINSENLENTINAISDAKGVGDETTKMETKSRLSQLLNKKELTNQDIKELKDEINNETKAIEELSYGEPISDFKNEQIEKLKEKITEINDFVKNGEYGDEDKRKGLIKDLLKQKLSYLGLKIKESKGNYDFMINLYYLKIVDKILNEDYNYIKDMENYNTKTTKKVIKKEEYIIKSGNRKGEIGYRNVPVDEPILSLGLGLKDKMHKHFVEDEKMLRKVAKELSDSESDEEAEKELMRHIKATKGIDKKIDKKLGQGGQYLPKKDRDAIYSGLDKGLKSLGLGFKATKIKVGKGIAYEPIDNPTYREFGKYRIHIPNLVEKNIANFKYPSLAVIQSIKPLLITDDYKEFLVDVLKNGNVNDKHYRTLQPDERKHFERVASGAGLIHKFKLTLNNEEEDIKDADRFNVLRGEYLAGNNNENMIKELRKLIVKFLNNGRISKNEGMNLLMELSL